MLPLVLQSIDCSRGFQVTMLEFAVSDNTLALGLVSMWAMNLARSSVCKSLYQSFERSWRALIFELMLWEAILEPYKVLDTLHCALTKSMHWACRYCKLADCDKLFKQANFNPNKRDKSQKHNKDNALARFEFLELLVRLAIAKYGQGQHTTDLADACAFLFMQSIQVRIHSGVAQSSFECI